MRVFIGIKVPDDISKELKRFLREEVSGHFKRMKEVEEENFHITLRFIGEVDEGKVEEIKARLEGIRFRRFYVTVKGVGFFPSPPSPPRVLWVGGESDEITDLKREIDKALASVGFPPEQNFVSHITLGRIKSVEPPEKARRISDKHKEKYFGEFEVKEFILFESKLTSSGPIYSIIKNFPLV